MTEIDESKVHQFNIIDDTDIFQYNRRHQLNDVTVNLTDYDGQVVFSGLGTWKRVPSGKGTWKNVRQDDVTSWSRVCARSVVARKRETFEVQLKCTKFVPRFYL